MSLNHNSTGRKHWIVYDDNNNVIATGDNSTGQLTTGQPNMELFDDANLLLDFMNSNNLPVEGQVFQEWQENETVEVDAIRTYGGQLYRCLQAHTTQSDWIPPNVPALWTPHYLGIPDWVQPQGTHDAYPMHFIVKHNGKYWRSLHAANVWEPSSSVPALWEEINVDGGEPEYQEWVQPTGGHDAYNTGDIVIFNGHLWESLIDGNVWSPAVYPAGWQDLGAI